MGPVALSEMQSGQQDGQGGSESCSAPSQHSSIAEHDLQLAVARQGLRCQGGVSTAREAGSMRPKSAVQADAAQLLLTSVSSPPPMKVPAAGRGCLRVLGYMAASKQRPHTVQQ